MRYSATIEILKGQNAAIIELTDARGEWAGAQRIESRNGDLYEIGYNYAAVAAISHGGALDRYSRLGKPRRMPVSCSGRVGAAVRLRSFNALHVGAIDPLPRCLDKKPSHWPEGSSALRWIGSGGSAMVLGLCGGTCPRMRDYRKGC